jgi:hypothetical protein
MVALSMFKEYATMRGRSLSGVNRDTPTAEALVTATTLLPYGSATSNEERLTNVVPMLVVNCVSAVRLLKSCAEIGNDMAVKYAVVTFTQPATVSNVQGTGEEAGQRSASNTAVAFPPLANV